MQHIYQGASKFVCLFVVVVLLLFLLLFFVCFVFAFWLIKRKKEKSVCA